MNSYQFRQRKNKRLVKAAYKKLVLKGWKHSFSKTVSGTPWYRPDDLALLALLDELVVKSVSRRFPFPRGGWTNHTIGVIPLRPVRVGGLIYDRGDIALCLLGDTRGYPQEFLAYAKTMVTREMVLL
jgi:hypothetical protein